VTIGLAAPKAKAGFVVGFGDSAAGGISESVGLITESIGLLLGVGLSLGASFAAGADLTVATDAAANSNVGRSALASFSRWPSGFAEPRGVAFGSANVNAPPASSADFFSLLGRDLREDATVFGRVKLSSDFVGDVDHFCTDLEALLGLGVLLGLDALLGFDALLGLSASNFAAGPFLEEPGLNMEPAGIAIDPTVFSADDLRGSLVLPTELSEKTGGPSSFAWLAREAAAGVAAVSAARTGGAADRGTSRLPRRIPPALSLDDRPLDFAADDTASDLDRFVAGGDVIRSRVSKIFRLVSCATGTTAVDAAADRSVYGALRLRGRWPPSSAWVVSFPLVAGAAAEPGSPTENHCAAAEPGAGDMDTRALLVDWPKPSHLLAPLPLVVTAGASGAFALAAGAAAPGRPNEETDAGSGSGSVGSTSAAFANDGRQLGKLTASSAGRCRLALDSTGVVPSRFCEPTADLRVLPLMQTSRI
jgi:hypothetical protein